MDSATSRPLATSTCHQCLWRPLLGALLIALLGGPMSPAWGQNPYSRRAWKPAPINSGFVFVDGQYIEPPYELEYASEGLKINGHLASPSTPPEKQELTNSRFYSTSTWDGGSAGERGRGPGDSGRNAGDGSQRSRRGGPGPNQPGPHRLPMGPNAAGPNLTIFQELSNSGIVVLFKGQTAVTMPQAQANEILRVMVRGPEARTQQTDNNLILDSILAALPDHADENAWRKWLTSFEPSELLLARATSIVEGVETVEKNNYAELNASRRLQDWAYPLTVFGMLMGVLSLGHLLQSPPKPAYLELNEKQQAYLARSVFYSLGLIVILSALDLTWTILAWDAGRMSELNPIGSQFMGNTFLLTLFKAGATLMSCGILLALRHYERAQWASWWLCLILTLLTFRWLVLNSMFVG